MAIPRPEPKEKGRTKGGRQKSTDRRWKAAERESSRTMQQIDGPTEIKALKNLQTSTGRIGHLTDLRFDSVSKHYAIEVKNWKLTKTFLGWWIQVNQLALDWGLDALLMLVIVPEQREVIHNNTLVKLPDLHCITSQRHAELLRCEREYHRLREAQAEAE